MSQKKNPKRKSTKSSSAKTRSRSSFKGFAWLVAAAAIGGAYLYFSAGSRTPEASAGLSPAAPVESSPVAATDADVPAFHRDPEDAKPFPELLPPFRYDHPVVQRAYAIAHDIPEVLAQQPCYCYCERVGHGSLLDCFASDHGAGCTVCLQEAILASQMTKSGKTPERIRKSIVEGEWKLVNLEAYR